MSAAIPLALHGGAPVRRSFLPFAVSRFSEIEIAEVADTLRSGWVTTGPKTERFENEFARYVGNRHAVGVSSGSAALNLALEAAGIGPGDEVVTTPLTFVATAHAILHRGAVPVFVDVDRRTLNLDPEIVERRLTDRTRAILPVHFAGRPCDMETLSAIADAHRLVLVSDSAHAIEAVHRGRKLARWSRINAFSFHPIKNLTTAEGGMLTTDDDDLAAELRLLRLHGLSKDAWSRHRGEAFTPADARLLGHKCNMTDLQASLGIHQLARLDDNLARRTRLFEIYDRGFQDLPGIEVPSPLARGGRHAMHLYVVLLDADRLGLDRVGFCKALKAENIGTGHHYPSLHRMTLYRERLDYEDSDLPNSAWVADRIVSLPLYPSMSDEDADSVIEAVRKIVRHHR
ncbi:MAG: DegT/DnrJ/EryC1/StrS family aminotransferase [Acidobacteriota bacterium]|nr:DegT/DnrJ/EryC1/StrS family aminotransferase [Acidobacteriota bacterium]